MALVVKNPSANAKDVRDAGSIPGSGRSPGGGNDNPLQYYCLENLMNRGSLWATVNGVTKSWTRLKRLKTAQHRTKITDPKIMIIKIKFTKRDQM